MTEWITTILVGGLPEAIYTALFMIFAKDIKVKRVGFTLAIVVAYVGLGIILLGSIWFNVAFILSLYLILKLFYGNKAGVLDIFVYMIAGLIMAITALTTAPLFFMGMCIVHCAIIHKVLLIACVISYRKQLRRACIWYKSVWNRSTNKSVIKSLTVRHTSLFLFNSMIILIHITMMILFSLRN